ncbi:hypothetical protein ES703_68626 [subsurface metagenome]
MNMPKVFDEVELLRRYKTQRTYSDSQLGVEMSAIGWTWTSAHLAKMFAGNIRVTAEQRQFIRDFLAVKYYWVELAT